MVDEVHFMQTKTRSANRLLGVFIVIPSMIFSILE
jgi:hypothetical protein